MIDVVILIVVIVNSFLAGYLFGYDRSSRSYGIQLRVQNDIDKFAFQ